MGFSQLSAALICLCAGSVLAGSFLRGGPTFPSDHVSVEEVQRSLLDEINEALGITNLEGHLQSLEAELSPIFSALPKNSKGFLGHTTVRYALHRLFVERHGWFFRGLEPNGGAWNSSSPTELLKDRVPAYIQSLIEEQLDGRGFTLRELTVLAASLEHLVRNEAEGRLKAAYEALGMSSTDAHPEYVFDEALDLFMMDFMIGGNFTVSNPEEVNEKKKNMKAVHLKWEEIRDFLRDVRKTIVAEESVIDFQQAKHIVTEVGQRFGRWQDTQCRALKDQLLTMGDRQVGRVPLSDFYKAALDGTVRGEHIDYLRQLGSLDESVSNKPTVVVANYINSPANCITSSGFYSVCCMNECEAILRNIEQSVAGPLAQPADIEKLVANMPSSTVSAPREISQALHGRLLQIAGQHDGDVPLHGRLFAQWLHHAYPRECPYPHLSGSIRPQTADEWMAESGRESSSTREEMVEFVSNAQGETRLNVDDSDEEVLVESDVELELPWSDEEELLVIRPTLPSEETSNKRGSATSVFRTLFFIVALTSMLWMVQQQLVGAVRAVRTSSKHQLPFKVSD